MTLTQFREEEEKGFDNKFRKTRKELIHFESCACWSCNDYRDDVKDWIKAHDTRLIQKIKELITEEMLICREEDTPTSRLTSLYMKLTDKK